MVRKEVLLMFSAVVLFALANSSLGLYLSRKYPPSLFFPTLYYFPFASPETRQGFRCIPVPRRVTRTAISLSVCCVLYLEFKGAEMKGSRLVLLHPVTN